MSGRPNPPNSVNYNLPEAEPCLDIQTISPPPLSVSSTAQHITALENIAEDSRRLTTGSKQKMNSEKPRLVFPRVSSAPSFS